MLVLHLYELGGALDGSDVLIGVKADMHRGALLLSHPIEHGKLSFVLYSRGT